jgi:hypothetical protein
MRAGLLLGSFIQVGPSATVLLLEQNCKVEKLCFASCFLYVVICFPNLSVVVKILLGRYIENA